jgi:hypothetical protein
MAPRRLSKIGLVGAVGVGLLAGVAVLGRFGPGSFSVESPSAPPPLADPAACPIPADAGARVRLAQSSGGADPNAGDGVGVLCAPDGEAIAVAASLECAWSADRDHVRRISLTFGGPEGGPVIVELHSEPQRPIELTLFSRGTVFRSSDPARVDGALSGAASGVLGFRDVPAHIGERATPNPAMADGIVRWACAQPPEAAAGESAGTVQLSVDGQAGPARHADATCRWVEIDGSPVLFAVDTYADAFTFEGMESGVSIAQSNFGTDHPPSIHIWVSHPTRGGYAFSGSFRWPLALATDQGNGTIRYRGFVPDSGAEHAGLPNLGAGTVSWSCGPPAGAVPPVPEGYEPIEDLPRREGTGSIRLGNPLDDELPATVTCWIRDPGPEADPVMGPVVPQIERIEVKARYGDERMILTTIDYQLVLERIGADGRVLGEYVAIDGGGWWSQDADAGPHRAAMGRMAFEPVGPPYVPLGGPGGPERFELAVTVDCRLP